MKILVDENNPNITILEFRAMGHDVLDIRGTECRAQQFYRTPSGYVATLRVTG
jgi:hypothetical protein